MDNIKFSGYWFGAVLTSNQQYIVLFGGRNDEKALKWYIDFGY